MFSADELARGWRLARPSPIWSARHPAAIV
jgi:hypothetical protein